MNIGDMMVNDKVVGHKVVEMESDGKFYTAFRLDSGVWLEPFVEETEDGPKAYMKMVVRRDSQKTGRTSPISPPDTGASSGDEEDSESGEGAST